MRALDRLLDVLLRPKLEATPSPSFPSGAVFTARATYGHRAAIQGWPHWTLYAGPALSLEHFPVRGTGQAEVGFELLESTREKSLTLMQLFYLRPRRMDIRMPDIAESLAALETESAKSPGTPIVCPCGMKDELVPGQVSIACLIAMNEGTIVVRWISVSALVGNGRVLVARKPSDPAKPSQPQT